jgi:hypothetical protein
VCSWSQARVELESPGAIPVGRAVWPFLAWFEAASARLDWPTVPPLSLIERTPAALPAASL